MRSLESLWNVSPLAQLARAIMVGVSVLAAAHYLAAMGVSLAGARMILLGV